MELKLATIKNRIKEKEIKLHKLRIVKKYTAIEDETSGENVSDTNVNLQTLIKRWSQVCEDALEDLFKIEEQRLIISGDDSISLTRSCLLKHLGIETIVQVDEDSNHFTAVNSKSC